MDRKINVADDRKRIRTQTDRKRSKGREIEWERKIKRLEKDT